MRALAGGDAPPTSAPADVHIRRPGFSMPRSSGRVVCLTGRGPVRPIDREPSRLCDHLKKNPTRAQYQYFPLSPARTRPVKALSGRPTSPSEPRPSGSGPNAKAARQATDGHGSTRIKTRSHHDPRMFAAVHRSAPRVSLLAAKPNGHPGTPKGRPGAAKGSPGKPKGRAGAAKGRPGTTNGRPGAPKGSPGTPPGRPGAAPG